MAEAPWRPAGSVCRETVEAREISQAALWCLAVAGVPGWIEAADLPVYRYTFPALCGEPGAVAPCDLPAGHPGHHFCRLGSGYWTTGTFREKASEAG